MKAKKISKAPPDKGEDVQKRLSKALAAGKIPEAELSKLTGMEEGEEVFCESQQDLADELGVDRITIINWKKLGAPRRKRGKYNVAEWKAWMAASGKKSSAVESPSPAKYELEIRKLTAVCERLELEHAIRLNQYHLNDDCKLWVGKAMTSVRTIMLSLPAKMAPAIEMRPKEECEALLRDAVDEALIAIHEKEWPTSKAT